jgi:hypothetical protein
MAGTENGNEDLGDSLRASLGQGVAAWNKDHVALLRQGVPVWNEWRTHHFDTELNLGGASLSGMDLTGIDLHGAGIVQSI